MFLKVISLPMKIAWTDKLDAEQIYQSYSKIELSSPEETLKVPRLKSVTGLVNHTWQ